jgi:hypothetical protein
VEATTGPSGPRLARATDLPAPGFFPPARVTPQLIPKPVVIEDNDGEEDLNVDADIDPKDEVEHSGKSATQIEDDVKGLFKGTAVNHEVEIKEGDDVIEKFTDDFRLLRHQIQAKAWMKERETGGSRGGILADDMGLVFLPIVVISKVELRCRLGKTIQTLVRIVEGKPHKSDRSRGYIPSTL